MTTIKIEPLTAEAFLEFGDVIEVNESEENFAINGGTTRRYHNLATAVATGEDACTIISVFRASPFDIPFELDMMERHPQGSQAFVPLKPSRFVVVVAPNDNGKPGTPRAFLAASGQGVNYFLGTWHGTLRVLDQQTDFLVIDRDGEGPNLDEHHFDTPYRIEQ